MNEMWICNEEEDTNKKQFTSMAIFAWSDRIGHRWFIINDIHLLD